MRALLVVNPKATTTSERTRDVIVRALRSQVDLSVEYTRRRGHAVTLARQAARDGFDVVVTLGGDGTVNEAVNGLMTSEPALAELPDPADRLPVLAVVPGGSTNVFARAVGLPPQWPEATSVLLEGLRAGRFRRIGLGRADDRYFTFCAGLGLDAAVIRQVERARLRGLLDGMGQLSEDERAVLLLVELEGLSYRDVSDVLNLPVGTVVARLAGTRERLRRMLANGDREAASTE